jgi:nucleotide-binding universal stress UspA family protein
MLVIDRKNAFGKRDDEMPGFFLRSVLNNTACPVLVIPSSYKAFQKIVLLYDGSPPSVHAMKSFCYLLPCFCKLPLDIVTVKQSGNYPDISDKYLMNDWIKRYFRQVDYKEANGDPEGTIIQYAKSQKNDCLFITGARPQGLLSPLFRESMADMLIKEVSAPIFVARY